MLIDSLQVTTSDVDLPYQVMLFIEPADEDTSAWESRNILPTKEVRKQLYSHIPPGPVPYTNLAKTSVVYGAICLGQRPVRFDLDYRDDAAALRDYHTAPVTLEITVRYHT